MLSNEKLFTDKMVEFVACIRLVFDIHLLENTMATIYNETEIARLQHKRGDTCVLRSGYALSQSCTL